uniref:Uncharacterized protein n=1 Tax=Anguilla anguilla TaxID=7936 RepID=A0A0E9RG45_ANGAN
MEYMTITSHWFCKVKNILILKKKKVHAQSNKSTCIPMVTMRKMIISNHSVKY